MRGNPSASIGVLTLAAALVLPAGLRLEGQEPSQPAQAPPANMAKIEYNFLIASGFLCEPNDPATCIAVAGSADGETVEISGAGTLNPTNQSVAAAGAFIRKESNGAIISTGIWTATGLVNFQSYGIAPGALERDYPQLRSPAPSPMAGVTTRSRIPSILTGPLATGGLAVMRIRLLPDAGTPRDALLRVNCAKGKVPEEEQSDGVRLSIVGGPVFDEQISGHSVFLLQRPIPIFDGKDSRTGPVTSQEKQ